MNTKDDTPRRCYRHFTRVSRKYLTNFWKISPLTPQESVEHVCSGTKTKIRVEDRGYPEPLRDLDISGKSIKLTTWPDWPAAIDCQPKQHALLPTRNSVFSSPKQWPWRDHPAMTQPTDTARRSSPSTEYRLVRHFTLSGTIASISSLVPLNPFSESILQHSGHSSTQTLWSYSCCLSTGLIVMCLLCLSSLSWKFVRLLAAPW